MAAADLTVRNFDYFQGMSFLIIFKAFRSFTLTAAFNSSFGLTGYICNIYMYIYYIYVYKYYIYIYIYITCE